MSIITYSKRALALAKHLNLYVTNLAEVEPAHVEYDTKEFYYNYDRFLVLTDEEADEECKRYVKDTLSITSNAHDATIAEELKYYSRGQIISTYDCTEYKVDDYYIYQI